MLAKSEVRRQNCAKLRAVFTKASRPKSHSSMSYAKPTLTDSLGPGTELKGSLHLEYKADVFCGSDHKKWSRFKS